MIRVAHTAFHHSLSCSPRTTTTGTAHSSSTLFTVEPKKFALSAPRPREPTTRRSPSRTAPSKALAGPLSTSCPVMSAREHLACGLHVALDKTRGVNPCLVEGLRRSRVDWDIGKLPRVHDPQRHLVTVCLVTRPLECSVGRVGPVYADDNAVGATAASGPAHDDDRARAVPDQVSWCAAEPERGRAVVATGADNDQVVFVNAVYQRESRWPGGCFRDDLDTGVGFDDDILDVGESAAACFHQRAVRFGGCPPANSLPGERDLEAREDPQACTSGVGFGSSPQDGFG